ncbi:ATP-binding cassette domain-containing protein [Candidatus Competibacter phosphatis]|uniref:ATP-binding cassette domain-containing protein n=1 Tax=Candidatus Competibacter phosphatis TaxID=221280 RepID=A0ABX1TJL5_9GAMM|nr:peptidase domain-containing ABC transporter [Candidatus Competibacter phosphatis]NMQ18363.1 ATP-binding cassette domain-containing protein [Candidatus Competibacter phosphatis]
MSSEILLETLAGIELLAPIGRSDLEYLAARAEIQTYDLGDTIFTAGEPGLGLYIVKSGMVRLLATEGGKDISIGIRRAGELLAETAALRDHRFEFTARASGKTELVFVPRDVIASTLARHPVVGGLLARQASINAAGGFISQLFQLRGKVDKDELVQLVDSIGIKKVAAGDVILEQDSLEDRRLYVVRRGTVRGIRMEGGVELPLAMLGHGELFGEHTCLLDAAQPVTVRAASDAVLLVIPQQTVRTILERNPQLKETLRTRIQFAEHELERQKQLLERRNRPLSLDLRSKPGIGERVLKRFPLVEQAEEMDCGAACLAMICKHYRIGATLGKLREMANVTTEGATLDSLAQVGESLGFTTHGLQCTYQTLLGFELPFIAHWEGYHYIVVYGVSKNQVWVADPGLGFRKLSVAEFEKGWTGTCLLFTPRADLAQIEATRSPWMRFVRLLRPHKPVLGYLILATLVIQVLGITPPIILQNILDRVVVHQSHELLNLLIVGFILVQLFMQLTALMRTYLTNFMVRNLDFSMMSQFFQHALSLPISFFAKRRTGDIFARFQENQTIRQFLTQSTISTMLNLLMVFFYFLVLFLYSVQMTLVLLALIVPMVVLTVAITPRIKQYARRDFEASTDAEAVLMETLNGAETIKAMGIERAIRLKWEQKYAKALNVKYKAQGFEALIGFASQLLHALTVTSVLWVGANLVLGQQLTIGQLIAFNMLMGSVMAPLMGLIGMWDELHEAGVAMERLGDVLDMEPEQKPEDQPSRILLPSLRGDISLQDVYFRYGGKETPYVLENISFELKAGETVALVGHSGSGKTTLAKLLVGFYPPSEGKISIDGYNLNLIDKDYYRAQIGYVMQSNLLFSGTVAENIALGESNPDRRRIVEVARLADAHGFISKLPQGYEQTVGERGVGLSGGQIQRLCIARSLYRDPRLLIFDEATSALDTQSETNILRNLSGVLEGRTALVIAHRLSTIMNADKILVLYQGRIVEEGTHQTLFDRQGMYYQLIHKQLAAAA